jgi:hypothetical protein
MIAAGRAGVERTSMREVIDFRRAQLLINELGVDLLIVEGKTLRGMPVKLEPVEETASRDWYVVEVAAYPENDAVKAASPFEETLGIEGHPGKVGIMVRGRVTSQRLRYAS